MIPLLVSTGTVDLPVALPTQLWLVSSTRTTNELQTESGKLPVDKILSPSLLQILDIHMQMCVYVSSELTDLKRWICWWEKKWWSLKICQRIKTQRHKANRQHAYIICGLFVLHIGSMLWYCSVRLYGHFLSIPHRSLVVWVSFGGVVVIIEIRQGTTSSSVTRVYLTSCKNSAVYAIYDVQ